MLDLAIHQTDRPVNVKEIAERQDLSALYLEQLMQRLGARGLVRTVRGRGGGFVLAKLPSQITLRDIVEELEGSLDIVECIGDPGLCNQVPYCVPRDIWEEISQDIANRLGRITLEDMARRHHEKLQRGAPSYSI